MVQLIASNQITLTDLNDAIIAGTPPENPESGTLWIDSSVNPHVLKRWVVTMIEAGVTIPGHWAIQTLSLGELDPEQNSKIDDSYTSLEDMAKDNRITQQERVAINEKLTFITGVNLLANSPSLSTLIEADINTTGEIYNIRLEARNAGLATNHSDYVEFELCYNNLRTYLSYVNPRPWDYISVDSSIIVANEWTNAWRDYYEASYALRTAVAEKLKQNAIDAENNANNYANQTKRYKVRYIRDWLNGSDISTSNFWVEIKAMAGAINRASTKVPTSNYTITNASLATNGVVDSLSYATGTAGANQYIQIDLGAVYEDIDYIKIWHYYSDTRKFNGTKTQISEDNVNWITLFDSLVSDIYTETALGQTVLVNTGIALTNAQSSADAANALLSDIASDSKLTPSEKQDTKKEWDIIAGEKTTIDAQATAYAITAEKTTYDNAYDALNTYITPLLANLTTTDTIVGTTFRTNFKTYYDARAALFKKIQDVAKTTAEKYVQSRGENLVTNGTGLLGNNTNFSSFTFDASQAYGAGGSFVDTISTTRLNDEFIPVNISLAYKLSFYAKAVKGNPTKALTRHYSFLDMYDADKLSIGADQVNPFAGTLTTLAQDLKPGDTVVYLTSTANWKNAAGASTHFRRFMFWGYQNSFGYTYPDETYTRWGTGYDTWSDGAVDFVNNTITLKVPWNYANPKDAQSIWRAGQKVSNGTSGGYTYRGLSNTEIPEVWTQYTGLFESTSFRAGTSYVKIGWLNHYSAGQTAITVDNNKVMYSNINFGVDIASRADLRLTAPLPTSITLDGNGVTATTTGDSAAYARLDYRGLYVAKGAIQIDAGSAGVKLTGAGGLVVTGATNTATFNSSKIEIKRNSDNVNVFSVDGTGNLNIIGNITMSAGSTLSASYITGGTLDASKVSVIELNASSIKAGTITVDRLVAGGRNPNLIYGGLDEFNQLNPNISPFGVKYALGGYETDISVNIEPSGGMIGAQCLKLSTAWTVISGGIVLHPTQNISEGWIPVQSGKRYIASFYGKPGNPISGQFHMNIYWYNGSTFISESGEPQDERPANPNNRLLETANGWTRSYAIYTAPANATGCSIALKGQSNGSPETQIIYWDGLMLEEAELNQTEPSAYRSGGVTYINGTNILTGTINADNVSIANDKVTIDNTGVTVKNADFFIEDSKTGTKYSTDIKTNLLNDHSFELIRMAIPSLDYSGLYVPDLPSLPDTSFREWGRVGVPYLASIRYYDDSTNYIMFGEQQIVVSAGNYVLQDVRFNSGMTYTFSLHAVTPRSSLTPMGVGAPKVIIDFFGDATFLSSVEQVFTAPNTDEYEKERFSFTFTAPINPDAGNGYLQYSSLKLRIKIMSDSGGWVEIDGVQLVMGSAPVSYDSEDSLWKAFTGNFTGQEVNTVFSNSEMSNVSNMLAVNGSIQMDSQYMEIPVQWNLGYIEGQGFAYTGFYGNGTTGKIGAYDWSKDKPIWDYDINTENITFDRHMVLGKGMDLYPYELSTKVGAIFTGDTNKSYINFKAISGSNDPGFIMHESSNAAADYNRGVLHLCPTDDNDNANDYVAIHGSNDPEAIKLYTGGNIDTIGDVYASIYYARGQGIFFFPSYGGGWTMTDTTWIRAYANKSIYTPGTMKAGNLEATDGLIVGGFDINLGTADQTSRGNTGTSRALVKDTNGRLVINFAEDFYGGTYVTGPLTVSDKLTLTKEGLELRWNGGTPFIDFSNDLTADYDVRFIAIGAEMRFQHNGTTRHVFYDNGTKIGGTIDVDGRNLGMSPIDSPQILLEYIDFDIPLTQNGTKVYVDETYLKTVERFAVFSNNGIIAEKGTNYFIIKGEGFADCRIIGERIGYKDIFYNDITDIEDVLEEVVVNE